MTKVLFLSGPMRGMPDYGRKAFQDAAEWLEKNYKCCVLNPAALPVGLGEGKYIPITLAMLEAADTIVMLPGFVRSDGARLELQYAMYQGKQAARIIDDPESGFRLMPLE